MKKEEIKSILDEKGAKYSECLIKYINNIRIGQLEEFLEILTRYMHYFPCNRILDCGEDWEVEIDVDTGFPEYDFIDFGIYVSYGEDFRLTSDVFLEILKRKYAIDTKNEYKTYIGSERFYSGNFKDGYKEGRWEYYTINKKREWNIYSPYGLNEKIEIRDYSLYINEVPFFDSYYPNGNIKSIGDYLEEDKEKYKTLYFLDTGELSLEYLHDKKAQLLEASFFYNETLLTQKRFVNQNKEMIREIYHRGTSKVQLLSVLNKEAKTITFSTFDIEGNLENTKEIKLAK